MSSYTVLARGSLPRGRTVARTPRVCPGNNPPGGRSTVAGRRRIGRRRCASGSPPPHPPRDLPRRQTVRARLDQQPKDLQPRVLRQRRETCDAIVEFHISTIVEL